MCDESEDDEEVIAGDLNSDKMIEIELSKYRSMKWPRREDSCPLQFYKSNKLILPELSRISKLVFCSTATSVKSECTFSDSGLLISQKRTRLLAGKVEGIIMIKRNRFYL